jgi:hypothetical protein
MKLQYITHCTVYPQIAISSDVSLRYHYPYNSFSYQPPNVVFTEAMLGEVYSIDRFNHRRQVAPETERMHRLVLFREPKAKVQRRRTVPCRPTFFISRLKS